MFDTLNHCATAYSHIFTHANPPDHSNVNFEEQIVINLKLNEKLINILPTISLNYLKHKDTITTTLIVSTIDNLNTKKAHGHDKISNKIIKYLKPSLTAILHPLLNKCKFKGQTSGIRVLIFCLKRLNDLHCFISDVTCVQIFAAK